jgi:hypothetical protein
MPLLADHGCEGPAYAVVVIDDQHFEHNAGPAFGLCAIDIIISEVIGRGCIFFSETSAGRIPPRHRNAPCCRRNLRVSLF